MTSVAGFVARLRKVDCCAVSDALDSLNLKGVVSGLPQAKVCSEMTFPGK
jgi:4-hydroxy-4-methyl-2-oxoglutarate aldolase